MTVSYGALHVEVIPKNRLRSEMRLKESESGSEGFNLISSHRVAFAELRRIPKVGVDWREWTFYVPYRISGGDETRADCGGSGELAAALLLMILRNAARDQRVAGGRRCAR